MLHALMGSRGEGVCGLGYVCMYVLYVCSVHDVYFVCTYCTEVVKAVADCTSFYVVASFLFDFGVYVQYVYTLVCMYVCM